MILQMKLRSLRRNKKVPVLLLCQVPAGMQHCSSHLPGFECLKKYTFTNGAELKASKLTNETPLLATLSPRLHQECKRGNLEGVKAVLAEGGNDINLCDNTGFTPFQDAVYKGWQANWPIGQYFYEGWHNSITPFKHFRSLKIQIASIFATQGTNLLTLTITRFRTLQMCRVSFETTRDQANA